MIQVLVMSHYYAAELLQEVQLQPSVSTTCQVMYSGGIANGMPYILSAACLVLLRHGVDEVQAT